MCALKPPLLQSRGAPGTSGLQVKPPSKLVEQSGAAQFPLTQNTHVVGWLMQGKVMNLWFGDLELSMRLQNRWRPRRTIII